MLFLYRKYMGVIEASSSVKVKGGYYCHTCNRCQNVWYSKNIPKSCTDRDCRSPYWNKKRIR